jgi:hypothetical protein
MNSIDFGPIEAARCSRCNAPCCRCGLCAKAKGGNPDICSACYKKQEAAKNAPAK